MTIPRDSVAQPHLFDDVLEAARALDATGVRPLEEPLSVWPAVAAALTEDVKAVELLLREETEERWLLAVSAVAPSARRGFASYCCTAEVIPFPGSPVAGASLVSILDRAKRRAWGTAVGAALGFLVSGPSPLALVTVPGGMIIGGTAAGVARGLEAGLEYKIRCLLGMPHPTPPSEPEREGEAESLPSGQGPRAVEPPAERRAG